MQTPPKPYRRERPSTPAPYGSTRPAVPPGGSLYFVTTLACASRAQWRSRAPDAVRNVIAEDSGGHGKSVAKKGLLIRCRCVCVFSPLADFAMTHRPETVMGRNIVTRWRLLAERRLVYLTELRDSGRWRRFYTEAVLAENIREAEVAVEAWSLLAPSAAGVGERSYPAPMPRAASCSVNGAATTRAALPPISFLSYDVAGEHDLRQA